ncbi:hypothetical protein SAV31267_037030 [Streptomyces avermitilis]|uniref:Uncharacterized protein n=1 Tax=Streptomyces avermitilis TaxID=33903 RepID=A0A4D4MQ13_STRAX|nr:hypothetical protein SAV31267_037030 [Streptomyces avermitilis]
MRAPRWQGRNARGIPGRAKPEKGNAGGGSGTRRGRGRKSPDGSPVSGQAAEGRVTWLVVLVVLVVSASMCQQQRVRQFMSGLMNTMLLAWCNACQHSEFLN